MGWSSGGRGAGGGHCRGHDLPSVRQQGRPAASRAAAPGAGPRVGIRMGSPSPGFIRPRRGRGLVLSHGVPRCRGRVAAGAGVRSGRCGDGMVATAWREQENFRLDGQTWLLDVLQEKGWLRRDRQSTISRAICGSSLHRRRGSSASTPAWMNPVSSAGCAELCARFSSIPPLGRATAMMTTPWLATHPAHNNLGDSVAVVVTPWLRDDRAMVVLIVVGSAGVITRIGPADWERFRDVRLASLSERLPPSARAMPTGSMLRRSPGSATYADAADAPSLCPTPRNDRDNAPGPLGG